MPIWRPRGGQRKRESLPAAALTPCPAHAGFSCHCAPHDCICVRRRRARHPAVPRNAAASAPWATRLPRQWNATRRHRAGGEPRGERQAERLRRGTMLASLSHDLRNADRRHPCRVQPDHIWRQTRPADAGRAARRHRSSGFGANAALY